MILKMNGFMRKLKARLQEAQVVYLLIAAVVFLVTVRGFIDNFLGCGTVLVDACFIAVVLWCIFALCTGKVSRSRHRAVLSCYLFWTFLCVVVGALQLLYGKTTISSAVMGLRNNNAYTLLFLIVALHANERGIKELYRLFVNCGVVICAFAIFQFALRNVLPESLLVLNGEDVFRLYGTDFIRVTGLMGNTVIFGGYAVILFALVWAQLLSVDFRSASLWGKLGVIALANLLTFSRASIAGMGLIACVQFLLYGCTHHRALEYLIIAVVGVGSLFGIILVFFKDSTIVQRLLNLNTDWTEGSDEGHVKMIRDAIRAIRNNSGFGALMGSSNSVITDGAIFAYLLEWGVPVFCVFVVLFLWICAIALRNCSSSNAMTGSLCNGFVGMSLYMACFSFVNSAYCARSVLVFFWMVAGMVLVMSDQRGISARGLLRVPNA